MKSKNFHDLIDVSLKVAKLIKKKLHKKSKTAARIIPLPMNGGSLALIPIYACLSSVGALPDENASNAIVHAINATNDATRELYEQLYLGKKIETIMLDGESKGAGMRFAVRNNKGFGLYLTPQHNLQKNYQGRSIHQ